jgi:hypothetical protein
MAGISYSRRWRVPNQHASRISRTRSGWTGSPSSSRTGQINFRPLQTAKHVGLEILDIFGGLEIRDAEFGYLAKLFLNSHRLRAPSTMIFHFHLHSYHRAAEAPAYPFGPMSFLPTSTATRGLHGPLSRSDGALTSSPRSCQPQRCMILPTQTTSHYSCTVHPFARDDSARLPFVVSDAERGWRLSDSRFAGPT